jgi:carboxyl-terminal processing protease
MRERNAIFGRFQHRTTVTVIVVVFVAGFAIGNLNAIGAAQGDTSVSRDVEEAFAPMWQVYNLIQSDYIDNVDINTLVNGAATGMVEALGDQFSGYMDPDTYALMNADLAGEIEGIGVVIRADEETGEIQVVGVLDGAPAQEVGILPGDIFTAVNGASVTGMSQLELASEVRGPEGTDVVITVQRDDALIDFTITRARIVIPNVESRVLDGDIGYLKLNQFSATARQDMDAALQAMDVNSLNGLVFDLRDNPGGLLTSAIDIASAFIEEGTVVTEAFSDEDQQVFSATGDYAGIEVPIVVLVNEGSASASELVAGAIQDTGVATLIGETTFGKGTVQTWHNLVNGGGVRLTIARWLTPSGQWIHENGVTPDIVVEWTPETFDDADDLQLQSAVEYIENEAVTVQEAAQ